MNKTRYLTLAIAAVALAAGLAIGYEAGLAHTSAKPPVATAPIPSPSPAPAPGNVSGGCVIGGCSSEICSDASEGPAISDCMYRAEFACYKKAKCERQADGACGWTPTAELEACLQNPPPLR